MPNTKPMVIDRGSAYAAKDLEDTKHRRRIMFAWARLQVTQTLTLTLTRTETQPLTLTPQRCSRMHKGNESMETYTHCPEKCPITRLSSNFCLHLSRSRRHYEVPRSASLETST